MNVHVPETVSEAVTWECASKGNSKWRCPDGMCMYQKQEVRLADGNVQVLETTRESVGEETASNGKDM